MGLKKSSRAENDAAPRRYIVVSPKTVALVTLVFVVLWLASAAIVPVIVASQFSEPEAELQHDMGTNVEPREVGPGLADYGAFGDMFGAVNSLFSGLALTGVVLTLWWQSAKTRREERPFLVPEFEAGSPLILKSPPLEDGQVKFPVEIDFRLKNDGSSPAIGVEVFLFVAYKDDSKEDTSEALSHKELPVPIASGTGFQCQTQFQLRVKDGPALVSSLDSKDSTFRLNLQIEARNLDGVKWRTSVSYDVSIQNSRRELDLKKLRGALNRRSEPADEEPKGWTSEEPIGLNLSPVADSWSFAEIA